MKKYGFIRVGNIVNNLKIGDLLFNREELVKLIKEALLQGFFFLCNDIIYLIVR